MAALGTACRWRFTSFSFQMGQSLSPHLSNAAILAVSVLVALAAERMGGAAATPRGMPRVSAGAAALDVGEYVRPVRGEMSFGRFHPVIRPDPFAPAAVRSEENIASQSGAPTVPSTAVRGSRLTAILVADDRRVAVIDD